MFDRLVIHGGTASVLWGCQEAVKLRAWRIVRYEGGWRLYGTVARVDQFCARKKPLLFTAPRVGAEHPGWWSWGLNGDVHIGDGQLVATLGPPEQ